MFPYSTGKTTELQRPNEYCLAETDSYQIQSEGDRRVQCLSIWQSSMQMCHFFNSNGPNVYTDHLINMALSSSMNKRNDFTEQLIHDIDLMIYPRHNNNDIKTKNISSNSCVKCQR